MALTTIFAICLLAGSALSAIVPKKLAGPPSEFASHAIPDVVAGALDSSTFTEFITFSDSKVANSTNGAVVATWTEELYVDEHKELKFALYSPLADQFHVTLTNSRGRKMRLKQSQAHYPHLDTSLYTGAGYTLKRPSIGHYTITVTAESSVSELEAQLQNTPASRQGRHAYFVMATDSKDHEFSHFLSYNLVVGQPIGLGVHMFDSVATPHQLGQKPPALQDVISQAILEVELPDGTTKTVPMNDKGVEGDLVADDSEFAGQITATVPGEYVLRSKVFGKNSKGDFERSAEHSVTVVPKTISLAGTAHGSVANERLQIALDVTTASPNPTYRAYAQVWGTPKTGGDAVAVAWIGGMSDVASSEDGVSLALELDLKWVDHAGVALSSIHLRDVQVQEVAGFVPVTTSASIPVTLSSEAQTALEQTQLGLTTEITLEMRRGVRPARNVTAENSGSIVMVHGYCAGSNPWSLASEDFTDAVYFERLKESIPNDEFSRSVVSFAEDTHGLQAYSLAGFSQGGMIVTHTLSFYFSGVDHADGGRVIQSLASPLSGNAVAGGIADLGKLFVGCGSNSDMTVDGASRWQATLSSEAKESLFYYTTQYNKGGLFGEGWCDAWANLVIAQPNDGVAEEKYSHLPGGTQVSHVKGQCHVADMNWGPSYLDHERNAEINSKAARKFK